MKIGIYGGSFNPIHNGHILVAKYVLEKLKLDKLIIVPVGTPSHREIFQVEPEIRLKLVKSAFLNEKKVEISDIEIFSKEKNYTYDTLLKIRDIYRGAEFYEIIGEDSAENFTEWKEYKKILELSKVVILRRKGHRNKLQGENIIYLKSPYFQYSSTEIREMIVHGEDISNCVPKDVKELIEKKNLYKEQGP